MSKTPSDLPDWLRDDDDDQKKSSDEQTPSNPPSESDAPQAAGDDDLPPWLRDEQTEQKDDYLDESGTLSAAFLAKADALPETVDLNLTYDQWQALQEDKARPRDIEEEIPDLSVDFEPDEADPALKQTGQLPDWFLGLEEIDESDAPAWFTDDKPKTGTQTSKLVTPPPTPPPQSELPDDVPPWLAGMDVPQTGGLEALEPLEDDLFADPPPPPPAPAQTGDLPDYSWMQDAARIAKENPGAAREDLPPMDDLMARMVEGVSGYDDEEELPPDFGTSDYVDPDMPPDMAQLLADVAQDDDEGYYSASDLPPTGALGEEYPDEFSDMPRFDTAMLRSMIPGAPKFANQPPPTSKASEPPQAPEPEPPADDPTFDDEPSFEWVSGGETRVLDELEADRGETVNLGFDASDVETGSSDDDDDNLPSFEAWDSPPPTEPEPPADEPIELNEESSHWLGELEDIVSSAVRSASQPTQRLPTLDENMESWGFGKGNTVPLPDLGESAFDSTTFDDSASGMTGVLPTNPSAIDTSEMEAVTPSEEFAFPDLEEDEIPGLKEEESAADEFDWLTEAGDISPEEPPAAVTESRSMLTGMLSRFNQPESEPEPEAPPEPEFSAEDDVVSDTVNDADLFSGLDLDTIDVPADAPSPPNSSLLGAWTLDDVSDPEEDAFEPPEMPDLGFAMVNDDAEPDNFNLFGDLEHEIRVEPEEPAEPMDWESVVRSRALVDNEIIFEPTPADEDIAPPVPDLFGEKLFDTDDLDSSLDVESLLEEAQSTPAPRAENLDMSWLQDDLFDKTSASSGAITDEPKAEAFTDDLLTDDSGGDDFGADYFAAAITDDELSADELPADALTHEAALDDFAVEDDLADAIADFAPGARGERATPSLDEETAQIQVPPSEEMRDTTEIEASPSPDEDEDDLFSLFEKARQTSEMAHVEDEEEELPALDDLTWDSYTPSYTSVEGADADDEQAEPALEEDMTWMLDALQEEDLSPVTGEEPPAVDWLTNEIPESDSSAHMFEPDMMAQADKPDTGSLGQDDATLIFDFPTPDDVGEGEPTTFDFFAEPAPQPESNPDWLQDLGDIPADETIDVKPDDTAGRRPFVMPLDMAREVREADELPDDIFGEVEAPYEEYETADPGSFNEADLLSDESIRDLDAYLSALEADRIPEVPPDADTILSSTAVDLDAELIDDQIEEASVVDEPTIPGSSDVLPANADWLDQLQASVTDVSAGAILRQMQDAPSDDLPDRLRKLRAMADDIPEAAPTPSNDALAPLLPSSAESLAPAPTSVLVTPPALTGAPALTPEQERNADLLRTLAATHTNETTGTNRLSAIDATYASSYMVGLEDSDTVIVEREEEPQEAPAPTRRRTRTRATARGSVGMSIERIVIVAILAAAIILPFLMPAFRAGNLPPTAFPPGGAASIVYNRIESLPPGALALVGIEYSTANSAELDGLTESILRHLFLRGAIPVLIGGNPVGLLHANNLIDTIAADSAFARRIGVSGGLQANRDYYVVQFLPGSALGLRAFSQDSAALLLTDINGQATSLGVRSLQDFSLIAVVAESAEDVRSYAEQVAPLARQPIVAAVSYSAAPLVSPYFTSNDGDMDGLLVGYGDGFTYSGLIGGATVFERNERNPIQPLLVGPSPTPTPTITPTFTASPTPSPTRDPNATNTPTPLPPTPTAAPMMGVVIANNAVNVRSGAGTNFDIIGSLQPGEQIVILGFNASNDWLNILTSDGEEGWVSASLVRVEVRSSDGRKGDSFLKPVLDPFFQDDDLEPTMTRTSAPSATPRGFAPSATQRVTRTPSNTASRTPVPSATPLASRTPTDEATDTPTATNTPEPTATNTASRTPVPSATASPQRTMTALVRSLTAIAERTQTGEAATTGDDATNTPRPTRTSADEDTPEPTETNTPRPTRTPRPDVTDEPTAEAGVSGADETAEPTPEVTSEPLPDIGSTLQAAIDEFSQGLVIDDTPSAGYREERWYATTGGIIASALIIAFGALINIVRGIFRLRRTRTPSTRRRR